MPVDSTHPDYDTMVPLQAKVRDAIAGEERIKDKGRTYLPALSGQTDLGISKGTGDYEAYKNRAMFYSAADRTATALVGAIMMKDPDLEWPKARVDALNHVGFDGESFDEIKNRAAKDVIGPGRVGLLVDAPPDPNAEPYIAYYEGESVTNWEQAVYLGRRTPVLIALREEKREIGDDPYARDCVTQYRVLRLGSVEMMPEVGYDAEQMVPLLADLDPGPNPVYWQEVWRLVRHGDKDKWEVVEIVLPVMKGGRAITEIPFILINPSGTGIAPEKPPLLDLVNVILSHYKNSADLEHGRHYCALPTPWVAGFDPKNVGEIGPVNVWVSEETDAKVGMLEFTGAGLGNIADGMKEKEKLAAVLGSRLLEEQPKGVEAEGTVRLRQAGERSVLATISVSLSQGFTFVLEILSDWMGLGGKASIVLNKDFNLVGISPQSILALMQAVQGGVLSWQTLFYNFKKGEVIPDDITEEDEIARIKEGIPGGEPPVVKEEEEEEEEDDDDEEEEEEEEDE